VGLHQPSCHSHTLPHKRSCIRHINASDTYIVHRHMHQTGCIRHMHASDTSVHQTHQTHASNTDTCIRHMHQICCIRHMHASDTSMHQTHQCIRHMHWTQTHASDMLHQTHACIRHMHQTSAVTAQGCIISEVTHHKTSYIHMDNNKSNCDSMTNMDDIELSVHKAARVNCLIQHCYVSSPTNEGC